MDTSDIANRPNFSAQNVQNSNTDVLKHPSSPISQCEGPRHPQRVIRSQDRGYLPTTLAMAFAAHVISRSERRAE